MRLIDAWGLRDWLMANPYADTHELLDAIYDAPIIDPESLRPVGRWLADGSCSNCGEFDNRDPYGSNFCQHCGAKMEV